MNEYYVSIIFAGFCFGYRSFLKPLIGVGIALWCPCLYCQHSVVGPRHFRLSSLLTHLEKQLETVQLFGPLSHRWEDLSETFCFWLLAWLGTSHCGHLGTQPLDAISLSVSASPSLLCNFALQMKQTLQFELIHDKGVKRYCHHPIAYRWLRWGVPGRDDSAVSIYCWRVLHMT